MEHELSYEKLVIILRAILYPELKCINITMVGPHMSDRSLIKYGSSEECQYTVTTQKGLFEVCYPDPAVVKSSYSCGIILHPGFSEYLTPWKPAMDVLIASDILVITTGYSNYDRFTMDAIHEDLVSEYYGAHVILQKTLNRASCLLINRKGIVPNAYYSIFKGRANDVVLLSYEEAVNKMREVFLRYVGDESIKYEGNPFFGETCLMMADDFASKKLIIPINKKLSEVEQLAHSYRSWRHKSKEDISKMFEGDQEEVDDHKLPNFDDNIMQQLMQLASNAQELRNKN